MTRRTVAAAAAGFLAAAASLTQGGAAWAAVTVDQQSTMTGDHATVVFNVRGDRPDASTTGLEIQFPPEHPLPDVLTQPKPGWVVTVEKATAPPSPSPDVAAPVTKVRWTVAPGSAAAIGPDQFDLFSVSVGPIPAGVARWPSGRCRPTATGRRPAGRKMPRPGRPAARACGC